ncbi:MAG: DNA polymerase I [Spirochaetaceae bacterium]|jgi:DNA polymerase-1|nr:DNA polymerase I [Spirochaetaceae bacterium]
MFVEDTGEEKPPLYIIDSYAHIYRSYFAFLSRPLRNSSGENVSALFGFAKMITSILEKAERHDFPIPVIMATFDSRTPTFRHERYPAYKATRQKAPEELQAQFPKAEAFLNALELPLLRFDGFEADDIIATLAVRCRSCGRECGIFSPDKDLLQLVGNGVYVLRQDKKTLSGQFDRIGPEEVFTEWGVSPEKILDFLSLTGDSADNVPGVNGVGEKIALKLMRRFGSLDKVYENIAEIEAAISKKLAADKENAFLSRELIRLREDVPIEAVIETEIKQNFNRKAAAEFLISEGIPSVAKLLTAGMKDKSLSGLKTALSSQAAVNAINFKYRKEKTDAELSNNAAHLKGEGRYSVVKSIAELKELFDRALTQRFVALDFETDSLDAWNSKPAGISLALEPKTAFYAPVVSHCGESDFLDPLAVKELLAGILSDGGMTVIAHNAKYDYEVSRAWGLPRWNASIFDTMIAAWLCDSGRAGYSLDSLAFAYLGYEAIAYKDVVPKNGIFADVPLELACRYSAEDADICLRMRELTLLRLKSLNLEKLFCEVEMPLVPVLAEMEGAGIKIEAGSLSNYSVELDKQLKQIEKEIWKIVGHEFKIASPKQLQKVLFEERNLTPSKKTQTGWSTDITVLEELAREDEVPELILKHRSLSKLKSTYVDTLGTMADSKGRVHTSFIQTGTATGRLSSRDPNLQNIPVRDEAGRRIREAFVAAPGSVLVSADYSQIELVILAHLSKDANLVAAFNDCVDVHVRTAALIFGESEDKIDASKRRIAKVINFGVMYGMSAFRLSRELKIDRRKATEFIEAYFKTYSGVRVFIDELIAQTERDGFVSTIFGRCRSIPAINSLNKTEKAAACRVAVNTPIQGSAADIVKKAMLDMDKALNGAERRNGVGSARLLLQVHDELILECAEEEAAPVSALAREIMENTVKLSVPLRVSVETGSRWGYFH